MLTTIAFAGAVLATAIQAEPVDLTCDRAAAVVYFEAGSSTLNPYAEAALADVAQRTKGCQIETITLDVPPASMTGSADRERAVMAALSDMGLITAPADVTATTATFATPAELATPAARRIAIDVKLSPRATG